MKNLCFIIAIIICLAVLIIPWVIVGTGSYPTMSYIIAAIVSVAGLVMLIIAIRQWATGGNCVFGNESS